LRGTFLPEKEVVLKEAVYGVDSLGASILAVYCEIEG
jgi:hypothetical protein